MNSALCTIITPDYFDRAIALIESARRTNSDLDYIVLTTDLPDKKVPGIEVITLPDLVKHDSRALDVANRYDGSHDEMRWSLKPVLLSHLLRTSGRQTVVYADCDICFFRSPLELIQLLGEGGVLLMPHWRPINPENSTKEFRTNFLDGLFNAGCVTANATGLDALDWWARACLSGCEQDYERGIFADQRYLDLLMVHFKETVICQHRGFDLADWNLQLRLPDPSGKRDVPDRWPVSMVHFTTNTIKSIECGADPVLHPYLEEYKQLLCSAKQFVTDCEDSEYVEGQSLCQTKRRSLQDFVDINYACRRKSFMRRPLQNEDRAAAVDFLRRLESASLKAMITDFDGCFGLKDAGFANWVDKTMTDMISALVQQGMIFAIASRRGIVMFEQLKAAFAEDLHEKIIVGCYSGSEIMPLTTKWIVPDYCERFDELKEWLSDSTFGRLVSVNKKLSHGGQLSLALESNSIEHHIMSAIDIWLRKTNREGWSVQSNGRAIDVLLPGISKNKVVDYLAATFNLQPDAEVLKIADRGHEGGNDYDLLATGLGLSCGTVSADRKSCWNFSPPGNSGRDTAISYLSVIKPEADHFKFSTNFFGATDHLPEQRGTTANV